MTTLTTLTIPTTLTALTIPTTPTSTTLSTLISYLHHDSSQCNSHFIILTLCLWFIFVTVFIDLSKYSKVTEGLSRNRNRDATITWTSVLKSVNRVEIGGSKSVYMLESPILMVKS